MQFYCLTDLRFRFLVTGNTSKECKGPDSWASGVIEDELSFPFPFQLVEVYLCSNFRLLCLFLAMNTVHAATAS